METNDCAGCGESLRRAAAFCGACGKCVLQLDAAPDLPNVLPANKLNPLAAVAGMPKNDSTAQRRAPMSAEEVFLQRREVAKMFEDTEVQHAVQVEFEREITPRLLDGILSPALLECWKEHWSAIAKLVQELRKDIADDGRTLAARAALAGRLNLELSVVVDALSNSLGDMLPLLRFQARARLASAALDDTIVRILLLRVRLALSSTAWIQAFIDAGIRNKWVVDSRSALRALSDFIEKNYFDALEDAVHGDRCAREAMVARFESIEADLAVLVEFDADFHLRVGTWLEHVGARLVGVPPEVLREAMTLHSARLEHVAKEAVLALEKRVEEFEEEIRRCSRELKEEAEEAREQEEADARFREEEDRMDHFLQRQQYLRQLSEGKYGAALITAAGSAREGAAWEGVWSKK
jgi:hypothetical protein